MSTMRIKLMVLPYEERLCILCDGNSTISDLKSRVHQAIQFYSIYREYLEFCTINLEIRIDSNKNDNYAVPEYYLLKDCIQSNDLIIASFVDNKQFKQRQSIHIPYINESDLHIRKMNNKNQNNNQQIASSIPQMSQIPQIPPISQPIPISIANQSQQLNDNNNINNFDEKDNGNIPIADIHKWSISYLNDYGQLYPIRLMDYQMYLSKLMQTFPVSLQNILKQNNIQKYDELMIKKLNISLIRSGKGYAVMMAGEQNQQNKQNLNDLKQFKQSINSQKQLHPQLQQVNNNNNNYNNYNYNNQFNNRQPRRNEDWHCPGCGFKNWGSRTRCRECTEFKPDKNKQKSNNINIINNDNQIQPQMQQPMPVKAAMPVKPPIPSKPQIQIMKAKKKKQKKQQQPVYPTTPSDDDDDDDDEDLDDKDDVDDDKTSNKDIDIQSEHIQPVERQQPPQPQSQSLPIIIKERDEIKVDQQSDHDQDKKDNKDNNNDVVVKENDNNNQANQPNQPKANVISSLTEPNVVSSLNNPNMLDLLPNILLKCVSKLSSSTPNKDSGCAQYIELHALEREIKQMYRDTTSCIFNIAEIGYVCFKQLLLMEFNNNNDNNKSSIKLRVVPCDKQLMCRIAGIKSNNPKEGIQKGSKKIDPCPVIGHYVEILSDNNDIIRNGAIEESIRSLLACVTVITLSSADVYSHIKLMHSSATYTQIEMDINKLPNDPWSVSQNPNSFDEIAIALYENNVSGSNMTTMKWYDWENIFNLDRKDRDHADFVEEITEDFYFPFITGELLTDSIISASKFNARNLSIFASQDIRPNFTLCIDYGLFPPNLPILHQLIKKIDDFDVDRLLKINNNISVDTVVGDYSAMHIAAWRGRFKTLKHLTQYGGDPMIKNKQNETALQSGKKHHAKVQWFLSQFPKYKPYQ